MTLEDDVNRLHHEWAALKAVLWAATRERFPELFLIYLGILACSLLATLVTL